LVPDTRSYARFDEHYPDGPFDLAAALAMFRNGRDAALGTEVGQLMDRATAELDAQRLADHMPSVGDPAPMFTLPNATGRAVSLGQLLASGPVVLTFYRGLWCPYCNLAQRALQQHLPEITELGASLASISLQGPDDSLTMAERNNLEFEVLSDVGGTVSKSYGLLFTLPRYLRETYEKMGHPLPAFNGTEDWTLPIPAAFVVDRAGVVRFRFADPDYTRRADPADVLAALRSSATSPRPGSQLDRPGD
jgi:peroxiredoxin